MTVASAPLEGELVCDLARLAELAPGWDALAVACALPQMCPAWVLAWWRHVAPRDALPRVVVVRDRGEIVGLAPYYVAPRGGRLDYRLPGIEIAARLSPLARPGTERAVAATIARTLAGATPPPDALLLEGAPLDGPWPAALRDGWPGRLRPPLWRTRTDGNPLVLLEEASFEAWLAGRSANFRGQMRRLRRRFADAGGVSRLATHATLADDAAALVRLHASRWERRGRSNLADLGDRFAAMVAETGRALLDDARLSLRMLELDGTPICAQLFVEAGGRMLFVNGGWDERHAVLRPSLLCLLDAVEEGFARGGRVLDLGVGRQPYKQRFADSESALQWAVLLVPGARLPLSAARSAPTQLRACLREGALRWLPEGRVARLRALQRRAGGRGA